MSRKSVQTKDSASLPEVLISPGEAAPNEKDAYWIQLASNWEEFSQAIKTTEWDSLIASLPEALWGDTLRLYLYRKPDDQGVMVKNPPGDWKYLQVFYKPVEPQFIQDHWGGGKYEWRLNWIRDKENRTIKRNTFDIWGDPKLKPGQTVEVDGKPVPIGATAPAAPSTESTDTTRVIDALSGANKLGMETLAHASETAIDMVKAQAATAAVPQKDPLELAIRLMEVMRPKEAAAPAKSSMVEALEIVDKLDAMAARRNPPPPPEKEEKETPLEQTLAAVETMPGGVGLPELLNRHNKNAAADPASPLTAAIEAGVRLIGNLIDKYPIIQQQQNQRLMLELEIRRNGGQPVQTVMQPLTTGAPAGPTIVTRAGMVQQPPNIPPIAPPVAPPPQEPEPGQVLVDFIVNGFKRAPIGTWGRETATALDFHHGELLEAMNIAGDLGDPAKVDAFVEATPALKQLRDSDARWHAFKADFLSYTMERWGALPEGEQAEDEQKPA